MVVEWDERMDEMQVELKAVRKVGVMVVIEVDEMVDWLVEVRVGVRELVRVVWKVGLLGMSLVECLDVWLVEYLVGMKVVLMDQRSGLSGV